MVRTLSMILRVMYDEVMRLANAVRKATRSTASGGISLVLASVSNQVAAAIHANVQSMAVQISQPAKR